MPPAPSLPIEPYLKYSSSDANAGKIGCISQWNAPQANAPAATRPDQRRRWIDLGELEHLRGVSDGDDAQDDVPDDSGPDQSPEPTEGAVFRRVRSRRRCRHRTLLEGQQIGDEVVLLICRQRAAKGVAAVAVARKTSVVTEALRGARSRRAARR